MRWTPVSSDAEPVIIEVCEGFASRFQRERLAPNGPVSYRKSRAKLDACRDLPIIRSYRRSAGMIRFQGLDDDEPGYHPVTFPGHSIDGVAVARSFVELGLS